MKNKLGKTVYVLCKNDELQLPIIVTDTLQEMSLFTGYAFTTLFQAYLRKSIIAKRYLLLKVNIEEPEDKFNNLEEYLRYCSVHNLKPNRLTTLDEYREVCFGY